MCIDSRTCNHNILSEIVFPRSTGRREAGMICQLESRTVLYLIFFDWKWLVPKITACAHTQPGTRIKFFSHIGTTFIHELDSVVIVSKSHWAVIPTFVTNSACLFPTIPVLPNWQPRKWDWYRSLGPIFLRNWGHSPQWIQTGKRYHILPYPISCISSSAVGDSSWSIWLDRDSVLFPLPPVD